MAQEPNRDSLRTVGNTFGRELVSGIESTQNHAVGKQVGKCEAMLPKKEIRWEEMMKLKWKQEETIAICKCFIRGCVT